MKKHSTGWGNIIEIHISDSDLYPEFIKNSKSLGQTTQQKIDKSLNRQFIKANTSMPNKYMERCTTSSIIREILPQRESSLPTLGWVKLMLISHSNPSP